MNFFIAVCAGIGFSMLAVGFAQYSIEKYARQRGVTLTPQDKLVKLLFVALASGIIFAIVTYRALN
jgi:hypothetical protein